jgi:hypothetical protein
MSTIIPGASALPGGEQGQDGEAGRAKMGISRMLAHRVGSALQSVGCLPLLAGLVEGGQRAGGAGAGGAGGRKAGVQRAGGLEGGLLCSCVIKGAGKGITCLVPVLSSSASVFQISAHVTGTISACR